MMGHWRDGGIGNMAGSDDRPIKEWTLLEKLAEMINTPPGSPLPRCLGGPNPLVEWATPLRKIAQEAFDEIERLREAPIQAAVAQTAADRNAVIKECIDALESQFAEHEKSNEAQGILHAMEFLETLKSDQNGANA